MGGRGTHSACLVLFQERQGARGSSAGSGFSGGSAGSSFHTLSELTAQRYLRDVLGSGARGVAVNQPMKWPGAPTTSNVAAFSGRGHSLTGSSSGNEAVAGNTTQNEARDKMAPAGQASPRHKPMEVDLSDEDAALFNPDAMTSSGDTSGTDRKHVFERVGPGYTRLNPRVTNEANAQSELFQTIASTIQAALREETETQVRNTCQCLFVPDHNIYLPVSTSLLSSSRREQEAR